MKQACSISGSEASRGRGHGAGVWVGSCILLCLCACSGSTDLVGVLDQDVSGAPESPAVASLEPADVAASSANSTAGDADELLVVAGLPLRDYQGPSFEWPLGIPLHAFFAESSWPDSELPEHIERDAFVRMGVFSEQRRDDVRFVASTGLAAARLRSLFEDATELLGSEPRSLVLRDAFGDEYLVVLGATMSSCAKIATHHGGTCADPESTSDAPDDVFGASHVPAASPAGEL